MANPASLPSTLISKRCWSGTSVTTGVGRSSGMPSRYRRPAEWGTSHGVTSTGTRAFVHRVPVGQTSKPAASGGDHTPARPGRHRLADLVALTGVPASTIHYYLDRGELPPPERRSPNVFVYDDRHVAALR